MVKVIKSRFDEIKDAITKGNESGLSTKVGKRVITLKDVKKLLEGIISGKIGKNEARKMYNNIADDANKLNKLNSTEPRQKILPIFKMLQEIFINPEIDDGTDDETDDETDNETDDNEQPDTTDMPDLESEKSAEQENQEGQGLKILTPDQMLSRLPINLAQLKAGNNSEKLKNEIRQLLYSLYQSKKLSKTIYNNLVNTV